MFTLVICQTGTVDARRTNFEVKADAHHALARWARGYEIQGYGNDCGTLTVKCGTVNQAAYTWRIEQR